MYASHLMFFLLPPSSPFPNAQEYIGDMHQVKPKSVMLYHDDKLLDTNSTLQSVGAAAQDDAEFRLEWKLSMTT